MFYPGASWLAIYINIVLVIEPIRGGQGWRECILQKFDFFIRIFRRLSNTFLFYAIQNIIPSARNLTLNEGKFERWSDTRR
jgi:hypothetical protein